MMNAIDLFTARGKLGAARSMRQVIRHWADVSPGSPAIAALDCPDMSYRDLAVLIDRIAGQLSERGFGADTRIALVHRGGASMMTMLLAVSACSVLAPLNENFTEDEFRRHITTRKIDAIIIEESFASPIRDVATSMGLPVIDAMTGGKDDCAGHITLDLPMGDETGTGDFTEAEDIAFIFATSGTTSVPKIVPLRHRHLLSRSQSTAALYELTAHDKCLNLNRLFLVGGVSNAFTALYAGGCVAFLKGRTQVDLSVFSHALTTLMPSWYVASFNFNVGVYQRLCKDSDYRPDHNLRFIRATSGRVDRAVTKGLEEYFRVPVIEAFSSSETGRISGNPLPPGVRKPGTVGMVTLHSVVSIVDDNGNPVPQGERGEVVARGDNVFDGYENNPAANDAAFFNGWYRTGDEGSFDADGYLTLTGRLKEMINRGGEKFSPGEIDEVLNSHPEILDAATFAVPHPTLGEVAAAAIVRTPEGTVTEEDLFDFLGARVTPVKVPRTLIFVEAIPRGPSGKIQRLQLSALVQEDHPGSRIQEAGAGTFPTQTENRLLGLWREVLPAGNIRRDDDFFMLGGDSLAATQLVLAVNDEFRIDTRLEEVFDVSRTIAKMAALIDNSKLSPESRSDNCTGSLSTDVKIPRGQPNNAKTNHLPLFEVDDLTTAITLIGLGAIALLPSPGVRARLCRLVAKTHIAFRGAQSDDLKNIIPLLENYTSARQLETDNLSAGYEDISLALRDYVSVNKSTRGRLRGREHIVAALANGRGAVLWNYSGSLGSRASHRCLYDSGFDIVQLRSYEHPFSGTWFGVKFLNPVQNRIDDRYLKATVILRRGNVVEAMHKMGDFLHENAVVRMSANGSGGIPYEMPFLGGTLRLALGAPMLALLYDAPLIPIFPVPDGNGGFDLVVEAPLTDESDREIGDKARAMAARYSHILEHYVKKEPQLWRGWFMRNTWRPDD